MKAGTPTAFQDRNGATIKVGDRIKHDDGTINTVDKFGSATSRFGIRTALDKLGHIHRGIAENGEAYARIMDWELTDEPAPAAPEGPTVKPGDDAQNMAPDRLRGKPTGKRTSRQQKQEKTAEDAGVQNGCTPEEARRILTLKDYQDEDLCDELRERGYHGEITKTKTIKI